MVTAMMTLHLDLVQVLLFMDRQGARRLNSHLSRRVLGVLSLMVKMQTINPAALSVALET